MAVFPEGHSLRQNEDTKAGTTRELREDLDVLLGIVSEPGRVGVYIPLMLLENNKTSGHLERLSQPFLDPQEEPSNFPVTVPALT